MKHSGSDERGTENRNPEHRRLGQSLRDAGDRLSRAGLREDAAEAYGLAVRVDPENMEAQFSHAMGLAQQGFYEDAIKELEACRKLSPDWPFWMGPLAQLYLDCGWPEQAVEAANSYLKEYPRCASALLVLGTALSELGRMSEAERSLLDVIRLEPKNAWAYNNLGCVYFDLGRRDEAREMYVKALKVDPDNQVAKANLDEADRPDPDLGGIGIFLLKAEMALRLRRRRG